MKSIPPLIPEPLAPERLERMIDHALTHPQVAPAALPRWRMAAMTGLPALAASLLIAWLLLPATPAPLVTADYRELSDLVMLELVEEL